MIGQLIESVKNPKNVLSTLIVAYVAVFVGYVWTVYIGRWAWLGQVIGFLGVLSMLITLVRFALTRILLGIVVAVLVGAYYYWYLGSCSVQTKSLSFDREHEPWITETHTRKRPRYSKSGIAQKFNEAVFAPAFMFDSSFRRGRWGTTMSAERNQWTAPNK